MSTKAWLSEQGTKNVEEQLAYAQRRIVTLDAALTKIDLIRNSIIGHQTVNWSAHIYPLVEALHDAGFDGTGYEESRAKAEESVEWFQRLRLICLETAGLCEVEADAHSAGSPAWERLRDQARRLRAVAEGRVA